MCAWGSFGLAPCELQYVICVAHLPYLARVLRYPREVGRIGPN
jgi:hypothetical protein